jgi:hypothetical protein
MTPTPTMRTRTPTTIRRRCRLRRVSCHRTTDHRDRAYRGGESPYPRNGIKHRIVVVVIVVVTSLVVLIDVEGQYHGVQDATFLAVDRIPRDAAPSPRRSKVSVAGIVCPSTTIELSVGGDTACMQRNVSLEGDRKEALM